MELIDLIADVLRKRDFPMQQNEIVKELLAHPNAPNCYELNRVKVKASAIARALSKNTVGTNSIIGIQSEEKDKSSFQKYYLKSKNYSSKHIFSEMDLHPILVKFAYSRFNVYCKTIDALKVSKHKNKIGKWTNPDIVGINPVILGLNSLFQNEVKKLGLFSTKVIEFYSFELKVKIDKSNITEAYFQAVSNSSWANYGYLVVEDYENERVFLESLSRLNIAYGIGLIKLNIEEPTSSEVVFSARFNEIADINFMNFLSTSNLVFHEFIETTVRIIDKTDLSLDFFDEII